MSISTNHLSKLFLLAAFAVTAGLAARSESLESRLTQVYQAQIPPHTEVDKIKVESIKYNDKAKTATIKVNAAAVDMYYTVDSYNALVEALKAELPAAKQNYKVNLVSGKKNVNLETLIRSYRHKNIGPKEKDRFVERTWLPEAPRGLDGSNIALWQSHGWYFEPKLNRWEWQRARVMQTVEDLYTQGYVMPFLMPMLENAGAYVMSPRERDIQLTEIIVDADGGFADAEGYVETNGKNVWTQGGTGFGYVNEILLNNDNPFRNGTYRQVDGVKNATDESVAIYEAEIPEQGDYAVYVSYATVPGSATKVPYTVHSLAGDKVVNVNQNMGGGTWIYLGHFPFAAGKQKIVSLSNAVPGGKGVITADAVKIGGGMGNVARVPGEKLDSIDYEPILSNYPRFTEGARYFMQWAGMPDSVYTPSENINDYLDDYKGRPLWVNYLSGGSSVNPDEKGLGIPVDLSMAWHTDAGTTMNDSIIGTLSIYSTDGTDLGNGTSRLASRDLADFIQTQIVDDVRAQFEPEWSRRKLWDRSYAEARIPQVPSMLLELLSHQNLADMKYGLDPTFRFAVSRAVYKGMLKYLADRDGRIYVVQPLPVNSFAISHGDNKGEYMLRWRETVDTLESSATPLFYLVEMRVNDGAFKQVARVEDNEWLFTGALPDSIYSFRVIAGNEGGISFPSEVLAMGINSQGGSEVTVVNGFTRLSAPDWFEADGIAGFLDSKDHGVPYVYDISYIGSQFEFRRDIPWMDDDSSGFGNSRSNYEKDVIAGNTFDYPYVHGQAIMAAGHSFISESLETFCDTLRTHNDTTVDLILGKQKETPIGRGIMGTRYKALTPELQAALTAHANNGGDILVTGSYVATDLWDNKYSTPEVMEADQKFAAEILGFKWRAGQASVTGEAYQVPTRFKEFTGGEYKFNSELNAESYVVESPDSFYAADPVKGVTLMRYTENNLVAATAMKADNYRTVVIGFPFEVITSAENRDSLMKQILDFFDNK